MLDRIYELIHTSKRPLTVKQIAKKLKFKNINKLRMYIKDLLLQGKIYEVRRGYYSSVEKDGLVVGEIEKKPGGFAFLLVEKGEDIYIPPNLLNGALNGDIALVKPIRKTKTGRIVGKVVGFLHRRRFFVGTYVDGYVIPDDPTVAERIKVRGGRRKDIENDTKVLFELVRTKRGRRAKIVEILGSLEDPDTDVKVVMRMFDLKEEFPPKVMMEVENIDEEVKLTRKRLDLRDKLIYTIDPLDAKDYDDAISIERTDRGYLLGVHIADVSHYVPWDTPLDMEARRRGTSVYLLNTVVPMLPHRLSSNLASLKPNVDRYAFSIFIEFDEEANILSYRFFKSVINSKARLTYEDAQSLIENNELSTDVSVLASKEYLQRIADNLKLALELSHKIRSKRLERGSLDFDLPEPEFTFNEQGEVVSIHPRRILETHKLIEDFMVSANMVVAEFFSRRNLPTLYRIHEKPKRKRIENFLKIVRNLLNMDIDVERITPLEISRILQAVRGTPNENLLTYLLLRSMSRAKYSIENKGHFGLALENYLHFTSPIRRYPDLVVHRLLNSALKGRAKRSESWMVKLDAIAHHSTIMEEKADKAQWEIWDLKKIEYIRAHLGEIFEGIITGFVQEGMFVELIDNLVEGFVPKSDLVLKDESSAYDMQGNTYMLGNRVKVKVVEANKITKKVIFQLM